MIDIPPDPLAALARYGDALAREMGALSRPDITTVWCPWYYYFQRVSEDDILANLERLAELRDELPLEFVQGDDGYQAGIGDWLQPHQKVPHRQSALSQRRHGRVKDEPGEPVVAIQNWEQLCYALDCTRPEVIDWLERVFRTVTGDWGYDYVKIDFVYAAALDGVRSNPNVTRAPAYRRGLAAIRRAVGERFVLGCGAPIGPSGGLVHGMRIRHAVV